MYVDVVTGTKVALCISSRNIQAANESVQRAGSFNDKSYFSLPIQDIGKDFSPTTEKRQVRILELRKISFAQQ